MMLNRTLVPNSSDEDEVDDAMAISLEELNALD